MALDRKTRDRLIYWAVWIGCFIPIPMVIYWVSTGQMTADPIKAATQYLGQWGLRLLAAGLAITPLRKLFGWVWLLRFRRTIGVYAFAYIVIHLITYIAIDQGFAWGDIWADIVKRWYITIGMIGFVLLLPLAITSTNAMIRKMGAKRWKQLHRLAYIIAPLGVLHYDLLVKKDASWPHFYAAIVGVLLAYRVYDWALSKWKKRDGAPPAMRTSPRRPAPANSA